MEHGTNGAPEFPRSSGTPGAAEHRLRLAVPFVSAILAAFLIVAGVQTEYLTVRDAGGRIAAAFPVREGLQFSIRYLHSVALLPCTDTLAALPDGRIRADSTTGAGLGAGLPSGDEDAEFSLENGEITIKGMERYFPEIAVLPSPITRHTLSIDDRTLDLRKLIGERGAGRLRVERLPIFLHPGRIGTGYASPTWR